MTTQELARTGVFERMCRLLNRVHHGTDEPFTDDQIIDSCKKMAVVGSRRQYRRILVQAKKARAAVEKLALYQDTAVLGYWDIPHYTRYT
jgi:hypothetical protein